MPSAKNNRILVTGGSGFLGSYLVKALVDRGDLVRILDNNFRGSASKLGHYMEQVEFVEADIRDAGSVKAAIEGIDTVCHLAFINGTRYFYEQPELVLSVGLIGTLNVLEACKEAGVANYIFASSSEVYQTPPYVPTDERVPMSIPDPTNPRYSYGGSKLIGEILSFNFGRGRFRTVVFRPHNVYGPDMGYEHVIPELAVKISRLLQDYPTGEIPLPIQGDGRETRAFCHVRDFTDGLLRVIDKGEDQNVYHIGVDNEVSILQLVLQIGRALGRDIRVIPGEIRPGGTPRRCPDITKLRGLGYNPVVSLEQGVTETVQWYLKAMAG
ncbi:MAG: NAD-dependent epimerase/dehydratase family protein [Calditrichaeota bacterium]|nr:NAD-dependent epimerase/dehydratase family protein [Calditrichota bacterium]